MSLVNYATRELTCKIVYYGPGRSGKTTNLHHIFGQVPPDRRGQMVSLATQTDRTLFFDFLPLDLGMISGFSTRFQLYTVPGQTYYRTTRKLVLQGADGVAAMRAGGARHEQVVARAFRQGLSVQLCALGTPVALHHLGEAMDDDIEETAYQQADDTGTQREE